MGLGIIVHIQGEEEPVSGSLMMVAWIKEHRKPGAKKASPVPFSRMDDIQGQLLAYNHCSHTRAMLSGV